MSENSVPAEIVQKAADAILRSDQELVILSREGLARLVLEAVWPAFVYQVVYSLGDGESVHAVYAAEADAEAHIKREHDKARRAGRLHSGRYSVAEMVLR